MSSSASWGPGARCQALWEDGYFYDAVVDSAADDGSFLVTYDGFGQQAYVGPESLRLRPDDDESLQQQYQQQQREQEQQQREEVVVPEAGQEQRKQAKVGLVKRQSIVDLGTLDKRTRAVVAILDSLNNSVEDMKVVDKLILSPLKLMMGTVNQAIDQQNFNRLFGKLSTVRSMDERLLQDLDARFVSADPIIGDVIVKYVPFFKLYLDYIEDHESLMADLKKQRKGKLAEYLTNVEAHPDCHKTLEEFLTVPTKRLDILEKQIADLLAATSKSHKDFANLTQALETLKKTSADIKKNMSDRKNLAIIRQIESQFMTNPKFSKPGRFILREGPLIKKSRDMNGKDREYHFYLFSDLLAYASKSGWKMKLHQKVEINRSFSVRILPNVMTGQTDSKGKPIVEHRFLVCSAVKSFVLVANDDQHRAGWVRALEYCAGEVAKTVPEAMRNIPAPVAPLPIWLDWADIPRVEEIFPTGTTSGGYGGKVTVAAAGRDGKGVAPRGPMRAQEKTVYKPVGVFDDMPGQNQQVKRQAFQQQQQQRGPPPRPSAKQPPLRGFRPDLRRKHAAQQQQQAPPPAAANGGGGGGGGPKFCPECGTKRASDARFCSNCGNKFF